MTRDMAINEFQHALADNGIKYSVNHEENGWVSFYVERACGLKVSVLFTTLSLSVGVYDGNWDTVSFFRIDCEDISRLHAVRGSIYISLAQPSAFLSVDLGGAV